MIGIQYLLNKKIWNPFFSSLLLRFVYVTNEEKYKANKKNISAEGRVMIVLYSKIIRAFPNGRLFFRKKYPLSGRKQEGYYL
jgi:hypothetical protein